MALESDKQYAIFFLGFVVAILLGYVVWQSEGYGQYHGVLYFGITVLVLLIINVLIFGEHLEQSGAFGVGLTSLVTIVLGVFNTSDLNQTIIALVITSGIVAGIYLYSSRG